MNTPISLIPNKTDHIGKDLIVLSVFDGICTGPFVLQQLFGPLRQVIAWEIDPEAILVTKKHFPEVIHRGDFLDDEIQDIAQTVRDFNHDGKAIVIILGAPPCPDFSVIKGDEAPGSKGQEGQKFLKFAQFSRALETAISPIPVRYLVENVVLQDRAEVDFFSEALQCNAVILDAADYGIISRPRIWWSRISRPETRTHPFTHQPLQWTKNQRLYRLHVGEALHDPGSIDTEGLEFHASVVQRQRLIPCLTTPSPTESGRAAPKKLKGRIDPATKARWLQDQRTYAPWQYAAEALLHDSSGNMSVPSAAVKEQLHGLPAGYTQTDGVAERSRHRLLANGWHVGVARLMLYLIVMATQQTVSEAIPATPRTTTLQWVAQQLTGFPPVVGPGGWMSYPGSIPPSDDMWGHWNNSQLAAPVTCIYTDAFFQLGDLKVKPSQCKLSRWFPSKAPLYINGWGLVLRVNGEPFFSHGQVPPHVLRRYCSRKAYIYFLEIVTQVICLTFFRQQLPHLVVSFIDNQPGKHALTKGFGKDRAINRLLAMVWRLITHYQWHVSFEWVRSQCNIADGVSRHDLSEMDQIGATELTLCLKPFWRIICRVADDSAYAYGGALHDLLQLPLIALPEWSRRGQCGED